MLLAILLAGAAESNWKLSDITDNVTHKREVFVTAVSDTKLNGESAALSLFCSDDGPRLRLRWPSRLGNDFVVISITRFAPRSVYDALPPTPWRVSQQRGGVDAELGGFPITNLAKEAVDAVNLTVVVHGSIAKEQVDFDPSGFQQAFDSVRNACPASG